MTESDLNQALMSHCEMQMPFAQVLKHADRFNHDYPDMTNTWAGMTSWWEIKFWDDKKFKSPRTQEIKCQQLAEQGTCYYVIYESIYPARRTFIVEPKHIKLWRESTPLERVMIGYAHAWVADFIRKVHENSRKERRPLA